MSTALEQYRQYLASREPRNTQPTPVVTQPSQANVVTRSYETIIDALSQILVGGRGSLEGITDSFLSKYGLAGGIYDPELRRTVEEEINKNYTQMLDDSLKPYYDDSWRYEMGEGGQRLFTGVGQGVGQMLPALAVSYATGGLGASPALAAALANATFFLGAEGRGIQDALSEGATLEKAQLYGLASGSVELLTERLVGGATKNIFGKGVLDGVISKHVGSKLWRVGVEMIGEGFEEALAEIVNPYLKRMTYDKDAEAWTDEHKAAIIESAIVGGLTSLVFGQTFGRIRSSQQRTAMEINDVKELTKKSEKFYAKGDVDTKVDVELFRAKETLSKRLVKMDDTSRAEFIKQNKLDDQFNADGTVIVANEGINKEVMTPQAYNAKLPEVKIVKEVTAKQKETLRLGAKMSQKVVIADIDPIKVNGKETNVNGYYDVETKTIVINSKAKNAQEVYVHELTHKLEGTKEYQKYGNFVLAQAKNNKTLQLVLSDMNITLKDVAAMYHDPSLSEKKNDYIIVTEFIARATSEVLFTDKVSIAKLAGEQRTNALKILNWLLRKDKELSALKVMTPSEKAYLSVVTRAEGLYQDALEKNVGGLKTSEIIDDNKEQKAKNNNQRMSISNEDSEGYKLSKEQRTFFKDSKIVDANGNLKVMYHSTEFSFNEFEGQMFFFSPSLDFTMNFLKNEITEDSMEDARTIEVYLNAKNPFNPKNMDHVNHLLDNLKLSDMSLPGVTSKMDFLMQKDNREAWIKALGDEENNWVSLEQAYNHIDDTSLPEYIKMLGYDGFYTTEDGVENVAVFNPNQVKHIDNKTPSKVNDMRYSIKMDGESKPVKIEKAGNLIAIHNLYENELMKTLELGGFPVPSIAITKAENAFDEFGDITVVFNKNTILPDLYRNKVYTRDIYSRTMPREKQNLRAVGWERIQILNRYAQEVDDRVSESIFTDTTPETAINTLKYKDGVKYAYIKENNIPFRKVFVDTTIRGYTATQVREFIARHPELNMNMSSEEVMSYKDELGQMEIDRLTPGNLEPAKFERLKNAVRKTMEESGYNRLEPILRAFAEAKRDGIKDREYSENETKKKISKLIATTDKKFNAWLKTYVEEMYDGYIRYVGENDERIGNDLSSLVRYMTDTKTVGSQKNMVYGLKDAMANANKQITTMEQLKKYGEKLVDTSTQRELMDALKELDEDTRDVITNKRVKKESFFNVFEDYYKAIADVLTKRRSPSAALRYRGFDTGYAEELTALIEQIKQYPSDYFEAKPQRAVGINEMDAVILPKKSNPALVAKLKEHKIPIKYYDGKDGSRKNIIEKLKNARFSLDTSNLRYMLVGESSDVVSYAAPINLTMDQILKAFDKHDALLGKIAHIIHDGSYSDALKLTEDEILKRYPQYKEMYQAIDAFETEMDIELNQVYDIIFEKKHRSRLHAEKDLFYVNASIESAMRKVGLLPENDLRTKLFEAKQIHKKQLQNDKLDVDAIVKKTGWLLSKDNNWKYRIDTSDIQITWETVLNNIQVVPFSEVVLNEISPLMPHIALNRILKAPNLFNHYPHLQHIPIYHIDGGKAYNGMYDGEKIVMNVDGTVEISAIEMYEETISSRNYRNKTYQKMIDRIVEVGDTFTYQDIQGYKDQSTIKNIMAIHQTQNNEELIQKIKQQIEFNQKEIDIAQKRINDIKSLKKYKEVIVHEIQHAIQDYEDWAEGGNLELAAKLVTAQAKNDSMLEAYAKGLEGTEFDNYVSGRTYILTEERKRNRYLNLLGELEARFASASLGNKDPLLMEPEYEKIGEAIKQGKRGVEQIPDKRREFRYSLDSNGDELSKEQQEYFKDSKARDKDGKLQVLYHGTVNGDFNIFDMDKTDPQSNLGKGFYFTTDSVDVMKHYADGGPDFENKIALRAEKIMNEHNNDIDNDNEDIDLKKTYNLTAKTADEMLEQLNQRGYLHDTDIQYYDENQEVSYQGRALKLRNAKTGFWDADAYSQRYNGNRQAKLYKSKDELLNNNPNASVQMFYTVTMKDQSASEYYNEQKLLDDIVYQVSEVYPKAAENEYIDYDKAKQLAYNEMYKGMRVIEAYLDMKNPYYVGNPLLDRNSFYNESDFDSEEEYNDAVDQAIAYEVDDIIGAIESEYNLHPHTIGHIRDVFYNAYYDDYNNEQLKEALFDEYIEDDEGNYIASDIHRIVIQRLGYDGIIDETVSSKFKAMNLNPNEKHMVVFNSNQIKYKDNKKPTSNDDIRYSLDSDGKKLSKEQQVFFKDSKIRDADGDLQVVYHGSEEEFTIFNKELLGTNTEANDAYLGFHFTNNKKLADSFGTQIYKTYLNIKKPFDLSGYPSDEETIQTLDEFMKLAHPEYYQDEYENDIMNLLDNIFVNREMEYLKADLAIDKHDFKNFIMKRGFDGMIFNMMGSDVATLKLMKETPVGNEYIIFNSNQAKRVDNLNPTSNEDIRYSMSDETVAKNVGSKVNLKVYSKKDAEETITKILSNNMMFGDRYYGFINAKTKEQAVRTLWQALNTAKEGEQAGPAIDIANYIIDAMMLEDVMDENEINQADVEFIQIANNYKGQINLDGVKEEVKYHFGKNQNAFMVWGKRKGNKGQTMDTIAIELERFGIFLSGNSEQELFIEFYNRYKKAQSNIKSVETSILKARRELNQEEIIDLKNHIVREVLLAWNNTGKQTNIAKEIEKYQGIVKNLKAQLKQTRQYTFAVSRLLSTINRVSALEKYQSVESIPLSKEIVGMIKMLTKVKTWRGNLSNSKSIREIFKKYSSMVINADGKQMPLYEYYHQMNNAGTFGGESIYKDIIVIIAEGKGDLTTEEINMVDMILTNFAHNVRNFDKVFFQNREQSEKELTLRAIDETKQTIPLKQSGVSNAIGNYTRWVSSPYARFERLSNYHSDGFFSQVYWELHDGVSKQAGFSRNVAQHFETFFNKHRKEADSWRNQDVVIGDMTMSRGQMISLYLLGLREQAKTHLYNQPDKSGIVRITNENLAKKHRTSDSVTQGLDGKIDEATMKQIEAMFTPVEKEFIGLTQTFFNQIAKDAKVETDIALFGVTNIVDDNYFPIRVAEDQLYTELGNSEMDFGNLFSVYNASFNKNVKPNANNKIVIENVLDVIERHTQQMGAYYGLAIPIKTFNRVWNKKLDGGSKLNIEVNKVDPDFKKFITKLLKDIQGVKKDKESFDRFMGKITGFWARGALGANPKVWATQFASLFAAGGTGIHYKHLMMGLMKGLANKTDYDMLYKYSAFAYDRARNGNNFDVGQLKQELGVLGKLDTITNLSTAPIGLLDNLIVGSIWNAALKETESKYKPNSEEHYKAAAEMTEQAIIRTQANWSPLYRPAILRTNNAVLKTLTMFTSEPLQIFTQIAVSIDRVRVARKELAIAEASHSPKAVKIAKEQLKVAKDKYRHYATAITVNAIFLAMVGTAFQWIKFGDEDDETFWTRMFDELVGHFVGMFPIFRDFFSLAQGYELSNMYETGMTNIYKGYTSISNMVEKGILGKEAYNTKDFLKDGRNLLLGISQTLGVPLRNIETYTKGILEKFNQDMIYKYESNFFNQSYVSDIQKALEEGNESLAETILERMMNDKNVSMKETGVSAELFRLYKEGYTSMPKAISRTVVIDDESVKLTQAQYNQFQDIYSQADGIVSKMITNLSYRRLDSEAQAKAIKLVYDYYHNLAKEAITGKSYTGNFGLMANAVAVEKLALAAAYASVTEADIRGGKIVQGSRKAKIERMMMGLGLSTTYKNMVMGYLGYSNSQGESQVRMYINRLNLTKEQKALLLSLSGY